MNKFSKHLQFSLQQSLYLANSFHHASIEPAHLLLGFTRASGSLAGELLARTKANAPLLETFVRRAWPEKSPTADFSDASQQAILNAVAAAAESEHPYVGTEHLLGVLLEHPGTELGRFFTRSRWPIAALKQELAMALKSTSRLSEITDTFSSDEDHAPHIAHDIPQTLKNFGAHLTDVERAKTLDPVVGRDTEIERLLHILSRRTKNNPILLGDPGVGKTAIVEGLAKRIVEGNVPATLRHTKIVALDVGALVAGTMFRGEFENRLKQLLEELRSHPNIVVFIDELHTIVGAGSASGAIDAANLLKPALARGDLRCIGATTVEEYRQHIETDGALERRFQPIQVGQPTAAETLTILKGLRANYEAHHNVTIADDALEAAVLLSERYLPDRFLPDKAIDLIDEAAARVKVSTPPSELLVKLQLIEKHEERVQEEKEEAVAAERYEDALRLKVEADRLHAERHATEKALAEETTQLPEANRSHVIQVLSQWTSIPVADAVGEERGRLVDLPNRLAASFIGHPDIRDTVAKTLQRARLGLADRHRPQASFLLVGPSGVGKTTLARALAESLFGSKEALLFLDMSEFSEGFTASKLIGAPAGYVGYRESGLLTERVRRQPYQVVCFDEIDRAHRDVLHLILQILGEGSLRDATGRNVNFTQTIIVATMNPEKLSEPIAGFDAVLGETTATNARLLSTLRDILPTELVARFDAVLPFPPLNASALADILDLSIQQFNERLAEQRLQVALTTEAKQHLVQESVGSTEGARRMQTRLREVLELPLAERLVREPDERRRRFTLHHTRSGWKLSP